MSADLDDNQRLDIEQFVNDFADGWAYGNSTGRTDIVTHRVDTGVLRQSIRDPIGTLPRKLRLCVRTYRL